MEFKNRFKSILLFVSFCLIGIAILVLAWIYFYYPLVAIQIEPGIRELSQEVEIQGVLGAESIDLEQKTIPLEKFEVTFIDQTESRTTGSKTIGLSKARGIVDFINIGEEEINLPAGTIVQTAAGIRFATEEEITVPAARKEYLMDVQVGTRAGQKPVSVEAVNKGESGNVSQGAIKEIIPGRENIIVLNEQPTEGGANRQKSVVSQADINRLKEELQQKIISGMDARIYAELGGNHRLLKNNTESFKIEYDIVQQTGQESDTLSGTAKLVSEVYAAHNSALDFLLSHVFNNKIDGQYRILSSGVNIFPLSIEEKDSGMYNIKVEVKASVSPLIDNSNLRKNLAGKSLESVAEILQADERIVDFNVHTEGDSLPVLYLAINIEVVEPEAHRVIRVSDGFRK